MLILPYSRRRSRSQNSDSKTKRIVRILLMVLTRWTKQKYEILMQNHFKQGMELYQQMLEDNIAKECARFVLPLAVGTKLYMTGNLRSWIHYINLRTANGTRRSTWTLLNSVSSISSVSSQSSLRRLGGALRATADAPSILTSVTAYNHH